MVARSVKRVRLTAVQWRFSLGSGLVKGISPASRFLFSVGIIGACFCCDSTPTSSGAGTPSHGGRDLEEHMNRRISKHGFLEVPLVGVLF